LPVNCQKFKENIKQTFNLSVYDFLRSGLIISLKKYQVIGKTVRLGQVKIR
jgi:hypothetical protein